MQTTIEKIEEDTISQLKDTYSEKDIRDVISFQWERTAKILPLPNVRSFEITGFATFKIKDRILTKELKKMEEILEAYNNQLSTQDTPPQSLLTRIESANSAINFLKSKQCQNSAR